MKRIICLLILILLISGCKPNPLLVSKCFEAKELTLKSIDLTKEYNSLPNKYGENISDEKDIETYNKLCGDVTGEIE